MTNEASDVDQHSLFIAAERLGGDTPIETSTEDLLGFDTFAKALALGLVERAPDVGFVVGLQARWGMGKSSAVNLCLEHVRRLAASRSDDSRIITQTFNPWFFSGVDALTTGYLSALTDAVEEALAPRTANLMRRSWRKAKRVLGLAQEHSDTIGASAAGAVTLLSGGKAAPLSGAIKGTIVNALKKKPSTDDLSKRFKKLVGRLTTTDGRVLIVVDDLDRLQPTDLRQVLSLVKTFGNLPWVTHLLVYDRDIVDAALVDARFGQFDRRLPSYREKIVQAEFDLPHATAEGLRRLIGRGINPLIQAESQFDQMDWFHATHMASDVYLRSPRDVVRFTNGLSVTWPSLAGEAYFPDLFILELWRLFERDFYDGIRDHRAVMTGDSQVSILDDERKKIVNGIIERIPESRRSQVVRVFSRLFPKAAKHLDGGRHWDHSSVEGRWRVGDQLGFEVFFRMCPPEDEYTQADIRRIRDAIPDETALDSVMSDALGRAASSGGTFLPKILSALYRLTSEDFSPSIPLLNVISRRGEEILSQGKLEPAMHWWNGREEVSGLAARCLLQLAAQERHGALQEALTHAGISIRAVILAGQFEPHNLELAEDVRRRMGESTITADEARELAEAFISEVEEDPGAVLSTPAGWQVISLWDSIRGPKPIKDWIDQNLQNPQLIVFFIDMIMSRVSSTIGEYRALRGPVSWGFIDLGQLLQSAANLAGRGQIPKQDKELVNAFMRDAQKRLDHEAGNDTEDSD